MPTAPKESYFQAVLWKKYIKVSKYMFANIYYFDGWESDFMLFNRNGYCWEIEIKRDLKDFRKDFHKEAKHEILKSGKGGPNKFFYMAPKGIIPKDEVPSYAGLIETKMHHDCRVLKRAPFIHKDVLEPRTESLFNKMYYNYYSVSKGKEFSKLRR